MYSLLLFLTVVASVLLIIVILLQASKGSGLAGTLGGASQVGAMFGTRRTADFLSRATWWLAGIIVVLSLIINMWFIPHIKVVGQ
jgi:preprotein translocase subunit SecG